MTHPLFSKYTVKHVEEQGWKAGSSLENIVAFRLAKWGLGPEITAQQHRVGRYRLDFAWPQLLIGLEADGWHHQSPQGAMRDAQRDSYLRGQGWLVYRIDDLNGEQSLLEQLVRVLQVVRREMEWKGIPTPRATSDPRRDVSLDNARSIEAARRLGLSDRY